MFCGVSAAVVAKLFRTGPAVILTSSVDRALADKKSTKEFILKYLGSDPIDVSQLEPGSNDGAGRVAYGQVSDAQRIVVDMLMKSKPKELNAFLKTCSFFLDEADHVLIEQAESLLYIASPCPSYHAIHGLFFNIQYRIDYEGDFSPDKTQTPAAIQEKAKILTKRILDDIRDFEHSHNIGALYPTIIDLDVFVAANTSGAMSARCKVNGKEYVTELTSERDHNTISNVPKITIIDVATGTESDGTRWTNEAPFIEAQEGLPIGGSEPLAFYSALPYLLQKVRWFGGITGTVGAAHTLKYYGETFDVWTTFRIPRNIPTTIYRLPTKVADSGEDEQMENIRADIDAWTQGQSGIPAKGPALIIAESIQKAQKIEKMLKAHGHAVMEPDVMEVPEGDDKEAHGKGEERKVKSWKTPSTTNGSASAVAHILPLYRRDHCVMEKFPDCVIIVASNKGGRGLDLKLDHEDCPPLANGAACPLYHHKSKLETQMGSVLLVILTDVLPGRQDEQAVGRCGRCGKAGVVQYHLASKKEDSHPTDAEAVLLERKIRKDSDEAIDLMSKCNRIGQHRHDGFVLDTFCEYLPTFVEEWMVKLFPSLGTKKTAAKKSESEAEAPSDSDAGDEESILPLLEPVGKWFTEYVTQAWAYWRGLGGALRQPGDFRKHFEVRMALAAPVNLPAVNCIKPSSTLRSTILEVCLRYAIEW